ncbi:MAG: tetratricopeptide repeat protein [Victivallaceae bacterium]|nr:tetratricopeptide repeat protein [Victivallaceae bacterium]
MFQKLIGTAIRPSLRWIGSHWFLLISLAGLLWRFEYLREFSTSLVYDMALGPDVSEYHARALEIMSGVFLPKTPEMHAPLYSWFLAAIYSTFGASVPIARLIQLFLGWLAWMAAARLVGKCGFGTAVELTFLALGMFYPTSIYYTAELYSESIASLFTVACMWMLWQCETSDEHSAGAGFLAGVAAGAGCLVHGMLLVFPVVSAIYLLVRRKYRIAMLFLLGTLLVVGSVTISKSLKYRSFQSVQSGSGFNYWLGNNSYADGTCYMRPGLEWRRFHRKAGEMASALGVSKDCYFYVRAFEFQTTHPFKAMALLARKMSLVWYGAELLSSADPGFLLYHTTMMEKSRYFNLVFIFFCGFGITVSLLRRDGRSRYFALLGIAVYLAQVLTVTSGRYRQMMVIPVILMAAIGLTSFCWRRWWPVVPVLICLSAMYYFSISAGRFEAWGILGEAAYMRGRYDQAHDLVVAASVADCNPDPSRYGNLLGNIAVKMGDFDEARKRYLAVIKEEPENYLAYMNLGLVPGTEHEESERLLLKAARLSPESGEIYYNLGLLRSRENLPNATEAASRAVELSPDRPETWNLLGVCLLNDGRPAEAARCFEEALVISPDNTAYMQNLGTARARMHRRP